MSAEEERSVKPYPINTKDYIAEKLNVKNRTEYFHSRVKDGYKVTFFLTFLGKLSPPPLEGQTKVICC